MSPKPIVLWTVPRSVSTAFERAIRTLPEVRVFHEPFTEPYYFGPERVSRRYRQQEPDKSKTYARTTASLLEPPDGFSTVFAKAMAYCAADAIELDTLDRFVNTFLIRDPRQAIPSLYRMSMDEEATGWTYFDAEEAGFRQLGQIYDRACEQLGQQSVVIDAADLLDQPGDILRVYCESVGLPYSQSMLKWECSTIEDWATWNGWHHAARESTGFARLAASPPVLADDLPDVVSATIEECMPYYLAMHRDRICP